MSREDLDPEIEVVSRLGSSNAALTPGSFPMRFGTEIEYKMALNELRWLKRLRGELSTTDFTPVANKYGFPEDFLKKGLEGLSIEDRMIRTSNWFPIIYAWAAQRKATRKELLDTAIASGRLVRRLALESGMIINVGLAIVWAFLVFMSLKLFYVIQWVSPFIASFIIAFIFFAISHVNSFRTQLQQKREKADEVREKARRNGYEYLVEATDRLLAKHFTAFMFTDFTTLERQIPELVAYQIGETADGKPIVIAENPEQSYAERLRSIRHIERDSGTGSS